MSDYIIGSDEVGYGAWAGPLYVCAVAVPNAWKGPHGIGDSKELKPAGCRDIYPQLYTLPCAIVTAATWYIDEVGVKKALLGAHYLAVTEMLRQFPGANVVIDGVLPVPGLPQARCVPKADALFPVVSAASIIAKVNRDAFMAGAHKEYPHYGWDSNVGYHSATHVAGLDSHGVSPLHRRSYGPIKKLLEEYGNQGPTGHRPSKS